MELVATIQNRFRHLANIITLSRVLGVFVIFFLTPFTTNFWLITIVFIYIFACVTDFFDGWVARRFSIVSDLGKILDPLADKILVLVFLPLLQMQAIAAFPVFIILAREYAIMALRIILAKNGTIVAANFSGKIKTAVTLPVCGILFARIPVQEVTHLPLLYVPFNELRRWIITWPTWVFTVLIWATVLVTIWSFFDYFGEYLWQEYVRKAGGDEEKAKRILRSLIPNAFSLLNLACGASAAVLAWFKYYHFAVLLVILGILFDALDGPLARKLDASSQLGAKLDSKADFVSFGITPAIIIYQIFSINASFLWVLWIGVFLAFAYYASVQYRLKRFDETGHTDYFEGLPSPVGAGLVLVAAISPYLHHLRFFVPLVIMTSLLMISRISYPHMSIARKKNFFKFVGVFGLIFTILTILKLMGDQTAYHSYVYEILFGLICVYVASPLLRPFRDDASK